MELFKLFGTIAVNNDEANSNIDETTGLAERSESKISSAFRKIGESIRNALKSDRTQAFGKSLSELTDTVDGQKSKLTELKNKYQDLYLTHGKNSDEAKACAKEIQELSEELNKNKSKLDEASRAADEFDNSLDEASSGAEQSESRMSSAFKKIGTAVAAAFAVDKIIQFGKSVTEAAADVAAEQSAFEQIMGNYSNTAQKKVNEIADATGMVATRLTPYMTSMTAKFKGLGYDIDDATTLASDGLNIAADAAAFWDMSLDDSMSHLNSFINGSYEGGEAIGLFANDTQMASYAVSKGLVAQTKDWAALDEATKQATRLEYAQNMMEASGAVGQAAKESDQYANVQANLTEKWRQFKAQIGEPLLQNVVIPAMNILSGVVDVASAGFSRLSTFVSKNKDLLEFLAIVLGSVGAAILLYNGYQAAAAAITAAKAAIDATGATSLLAYAAAQAAALAPMIAAVAAISAIIAIIILCIKHWDDIHKKVSDVANGIKTKISEMKEKVVGKFNELKTGITDKVNAVKKTVTDKFNAVKKAITQPVEDAKTAVKKAINKIKGFFDFKWSLPKLKMPHVSIKGSFSLVPPSVPKFSVDWYAKAMDNAMLLNSPTIFGVNGSGRLMGGGEAGQEVVSGSGTLMNMIRGAVRQETSASYEISNRILAILAEYLPFVPEIAKMKMVMNNGVLIGQLAPEIDNQLGNINRLKERGQ